MDPRQRAPFDYRAYIPDEIATVDPVMSSSVAQLLHKADEAVRELNHGDGHAITVTSNTRVLVSADLVECRLATPHPGSHKPAGPAPFLN